MEVIYNEARIRTAVEFLIYKIRNEVDLSNPTYICVLDGGVPFFKDMTRYLPSGNCLYIKASSYKGNIKSDGGVDISVPYDLDKELSDNILIFDDIWDTGCTCINIIDMLLRIRPEAKITTIVALHRDISISSSKYAAFTTKSRDFFAGYGMDNNGRDRNLPYIYAVKEDEVFPS